MSYNLGDERALTDARTANDRDLSIEQNINRALLLTNGQINMTPNLGAQSSRSGYGTNNIISSYAHV